MVVTGFFVLCSLLVSDTSASLRQHDYISSSVKKVKEYNHVDRVNIIASAIDP